MDFSQYQGPLAMALRRLFERGPADPWPQEVDAAVRAGDASPVCLNCLRPQSEHYWFCKDCGFPGGEYMTVMPYLHVFPLGEMFRRGVLGPPERKPGALFGYVLVSWCEYAVFAPVYWFFLLSNPKHPHNERESAEAQDVQQ